jgi:hypothetical protein
MRRVLQLIVVLASLCALAAAMPVAFQAHHLSGNVPYVASMRFSDLNFTSFSATEQYSAYLCEQPVKIVRLQANYAVVHISERPKDAKACMFYIFRAGERVYADSMVGFHARRPEEPMMYDSFPSFYIADADETTRVRVSGKNLKSVESVYTNSLGPRLDCTKLIVDDEGLSCDLPVLDAASIPASGTTELVFRIDHKDPVLTDFFTVQPIRRDEAVVSSISESVVYSGARVTLRLSRPLTTAVTLPWTPVLVHVPTGKVESGASFSHFDWSTDTTALTVTIHCVSCLAGAHYVRLGEASASTARALTPGSAIVSIQHLPCSFTAPRTVPATATETALGSRLETLSLSIDLDSAPRGEIRVTAGVLETPLSVEHFPMARRGGSFLKLSFLNTWVPPPGFVSLSVETWVGGRLVDKCSVPQAFEVIQDDSRVPQIHSISQRLFTSLGGVDAVVLTGENLERAKSLRVMYNGVSALGPECKELATNATTLTCVFPNRQIDKTEQFAFVALDASGAELARIPGLFTDYMTDSALVAPEFISVGEETRVVIQFSTVPPACVPLLPLLLNEDGTPVRATGQWLDDMTIVFTDAVFTSFSKRAGRMVLRELLATPQEGEPPVDHFVMQLRIYSYVEPKAVIRGVYPSHVQVFALDGETPTMVRVDVDGYHLIEDKIGVVRIGDVVADKVVSKGGALYIQQTFKKVEWNYDIVIYSRNHKTVLATLKNAFIVESDGQRPGRAAVWMHGHKNYVAVASQLNEVVLVASFYNVQYPENVGINSSHGRIATVSSKDTASMTTFTVLMERCKDGSLTCFAGGVTLTFSFPSVEAPFDLHASFLVAPAPTVLRVWPNTTLDFAASGGTCIEYAVELQEATARHPLALGFPFNAGLRAINVAVDERTSTHTGCLVCDKCAEGEFAAALGGPYTDFQVMTHELPKTTFTIVTSPFTSYIGVNESSLAAVVLQSESHVGKSGKEPQPKDSHTLAFLFTATVGVALIAAAVVAWRCLAARKALTQIKARKYDVLPTEVPTEVSYDRL